jgi:hypothetical protein
MNTRIARNGLTVRQVLDQLKATQYSSISNGLRILAAANVLQMQKFGQTVRYLLPTNPHQITSDDEFNIVYFPIGKRTHQFTEAITAMFNKETERTETTAGAITAKRTDMMVLVDCGMQEFPSSHQKCHMEGKNIKT